MLNITWKLYWYICFYFVPEISIYKSLRMFPLTFYLQRLYLKVVIFSSIYDILWLFLIWYIWWTSMALTMYVYQVHFSSVYRPCVMYKMNITLLCVKYIALYIILSIYTSRSLKLLLYLIYCIHTLKYHSLEVFWRSRFISQCK